MDCSVVSQRKSTGFAGSTPASAGKTPASACRSGTPAERSGSSGAGTRISAGRSPTTGSGSSTAAGKSGTSRAGSRITAGRSGTAAKSSLCVAPMEWAPRKKRDGATSGGAIFCPATSKAGQEPKLPKLSGFPAFRLSECTRTKILGCRIWNEGRRSSELWIKFLRGIKFPEMNHEEKSYIFSLPILSTPKRHSSLSVITRVVKQISGAAILANCHTGQAKPRYFRPTQ